MAKGGKLTKLTSILKKLSSFNKHSGSSGRSNRSVIISPTHHSSNELKPNEDGHQQVHAVYVGKSRRKYLINNEVMEHPLFQELVVGCEDGDDDLLVVGCEVVMFEHLLWMIDNADPQPELVHYYAC